MNIARLIALLCAAALFACSTASAPPPVSVPPAVSAAAPPPPAPAPKTVAKSPASKPASASAPAPAAKPAPATKRAPAPVAQATKPAPLDLKTLEQRLKDTSAIGVMTKLSLKNQVDDLIARFRTYHAGSRPPTLPELRPAFELLLMKALALLQDKDPALAKDIDASRETIWSVLSDRNKFTQLTT